MIWWLFGKKKKVEAKDVKKTSCKAPEVKMEKVGEITHYFPHVNAGVVVVRKGSLAVGDTICIKGHTTDFKQKVESMQVDHKSVENAKTGDEIGLMVKERVRIGDEVFKL